MRFNKKLSYRKQIARRQRTQSNNSKFQLGVFNGGRKHTGHRWWRPLARKHKFQGEIVFQGEETFVAPLRVAAATERGVR